MVLLTTVNWKVRWGTNMSSMEPICHLWNQYGFYGTNMSSMEPIWLLWNQYVIYGTNMASMEPICHLWNQYGFYGTNMASMEPIWLLWRKAPFGTHVCFINSCLLLSFFLLFVYLLIINCDWCMCLIQNDHICGSMHPLEQMSIKS